MRNPRWLDKQSTRVAVYLFLYGTLVHAMLLRLYFLWAYPNPSDKVLPNSTVAQAGIPVLAGVSFVLVMLPFLKKRRESGGAVSLLGFIVRGGIKGLAATWLALFVSFLLISLVASVRESGVAAPLSFFYFLLGTITYGMEPVILTVPFSFFCGALCAGTSVLVNRR